MKRLMLQGDTHANTGAMRRALEQAANDNCDAVLQLGDFGYWPREEFGRKFLEKTSKWTERTGIPVYWLDGNHEDFASFDCHADEIVEVRDGIFYIPRGYMWEWSGVRLMAMGGAVSIDRDAREPGRSWFTEEQITEDDIAKVDGKTCDVMFTHDAPLNPLTRYKDDPESEMHRQKLRRVVLGVKPKVLYHGHYHMAHESSVRHEDGHTLVVGLHLENNNRAMKVLDLEKWNGTASS